MCTRSQSRNSNRQQQQVPPTFVEPFNLVEPIENQAPPVVTMVDNRTMAQLLEAPTEGYEDDIVVPEITADNFELKHSLLTLVQNKHFFGHDKEDPHAHIHYFTKITSTMKFSNVPSTSVKLMLFPFSLEGALALNEDNIFQADECDAFIQMLMMNRLLSLYSWPICPQPGQQIHKESLWTSLVSIWVTVQVILYEQYLSVDNISVVPSCASSALNDVCVSSDNDAFVPHDPIATKLKIYKEQVAIYEQRAKFELTEREQRMDDQMRMLIQNHNKTEENLKKELHSVKLQLNSTMENNKIIEETVYDQKTKTALGADNPFELRQAKKAQPALYDGEELLKTHHVPVIVPSSEEDLELAETTRNKLHAKMNDMYLCSGKGRVNITPPNYSKENFMATFTPQTQLTPEQVFWAMKAVFENLEAEVDQNEIELKSGEIERKNLLITNENLIVECLSKDCFILQMIMYLMCLEFSDMHDAFTIAQKRNMIRELKEKISRLTKKNSDADPTFGLKALVSQNKDLTAKLNILHDLNERFRAENAKFKQHYKELYDLIKITRAKTTDQNNSLLSEIENLKAQLKDNSKCVTIPDSKPKVLAPGRYPIDVEPIPPRLKKNREVHLHYIKHLKENVETLLEIVEDAKVERPLDTSLSSACRYTKHSQELLEYVIGTCPKDFSPRDKQNASTNSLRKKRVTFVEPCETSAHNTPPQVEHQKINSTNALGIISTGVKGALAASRSKPRRNTKKDRTLPAKSALKQVKAHYKMNKSNEKKKNRVDSSISCKRTVINSNSNTSCKTCNKCLISVNHDQCVMRSEMFVKQSPATKCPLVRSTALKSYYMPADPKETIAPVVQIVLWYLDSGCSKHMIGDRSRLRNFVKKFIGTVRFGNDHFGAIMGYGDYVIGDSVISRVYYVEGLGHYLFSVGQFCDSDLEVAFRKHTCFVQELDGVDLIKGSHGTNLYTISVEDMMRSSPICLLSKASKNKSWLWHRRLNHLNFGTLNDLARKDLVRGLPRLKFEKDHLCSACQLGKSRKATHKPKMINTIMEVLHTLYMDLYRPLRVQSINGKKYIVVIVDDYSRFTWVKFLRSKDETPAFVINLLKQLQVGLNKIVKFVRTDNGTEFVNKALIDYYESIDITHEKTVSRTPQQNGIVERRNRTLVEAARTILIFSKAPLFLWAEAVATACYT
ncbi:retrovirus-related pol polyprotein from transposon TNT 1-94 [Tanacetum coccineum]